MTKECRNKLRALAAAATPGPWGWEPVGDKDNAWCLGTTDPPTAGRIEDPNECVDEWIAEGPNNFANAEYIASVSPDVAIALLDRIDELESASRENGMLIEGLYDTQAKLDAAEAREARLREALLAARMYLRKIRTGNDVGLYDAIRAAWPSYWEEPGDEWNPPRKP